MFSKEEKRNLNAQFFSKFVRHMSRHHSTGGGGGRWEAYKTGVKDLYFRLLTFPEVGLAIDLQFKDAEIRALFYDQFIELRKLLENHVGAPAVFFEEFTLESGVVVSRIVWTLPNAYFYDEKQWDTILSWYEVKLLGLDEFWEYAGDVVKALAR
jgi:hypothetical protein